MLARALRIICLASLLAFTAHSQTAPDYPAYTDLYVNDFADLLSPEQEQSIRSKLSQLKETEDIELTLITIASRKDYGRSRSIESFATGLFNHWGIGNPQRNDGVMVLIAKEDRDMRIELGAGYSWRRDTDMKLIIDRYFLPEFRNGYYDRGILQGIDATIQDISRRPAGTVSSAAPSTFESVGADTGKQSAENTISAILAFLLGLPGVGAIVYFFRKWLRRRPRACPNCTNKMALLTEANEDKYLPDANQLEELAKSVEYDVWSCGYCNHMTIKRYPRLFSGFGACPSCNYRLLESDRTVISSATYTSSGQERIDYQCLNCNHTDTEYRTIPRKQKSTSSSSSGSFGGGSSSGGGASGSW